MPRLFTTENENAAIIFALNTIDPYALQDLFAGFGVSENEITPNMVRYLVETEKDAFLVPFSRLAKEVLDDEEKMAKIEQQYLSLKRQNGDKKEKNSTNKDNKDNKNEKSEAYTAESAKWDELISQEKDPQKRAELMKEKQAALKEIQNSGVWNEIKGTLGDIFNFGLLGWDMYNKTKQIEVDSKNADNDAKNGTTETTEQPKVGLYIGIGVGVLLLVIILIVALRKK